MIVEGVSKLQYIAGKDILDTHAVCYSSRTAVRERLVISHHLAWFCPLPYPQVNQFGSAKTVRNSTVVTHVRIGDVYIKLGVAYRRTHR